MITAASVVIAALFAGWLLHKLATVQVASENTFSLKLSTLSCEWFLLAGPYWWELLPVRPAAK